MKHYIKRHCGQHVGMAWQVEAGDVEEGDVDQPIAFLDTETLADAMMTVLTGRAAPFECGEAYEAANAVISVNVGDTREWQYIGDCAWIFGEKVRGAMRHPLGGVHWASGSWHWVVASRGMSGSADKYVEGIIAVEAALGITS